MVFTAAQGQLYVYLYGITHLGARDAELAYHAQSHACTCVRVDDLHAGVWDRDARRTEVLAAPL
jgi:hypothetical protein